MLNKNREYDPPLDASLAMTWNAGCTHTSIADNVSNESIFKVRNITSDVFRPIKLCIIWFLNSPDKKRN